MSFNIDARICATNCTPIVLENLANCPQDKSFWGGRISEILLVDCSEPFTQSDLSDHTYWSGLVTANKLVRMFGTGSYQIDESLKADGGSCDGEEIAQVTWQLLFEQRKFDLDLFKDHENANRILQGAWSNYNMVARYCKPDSETLLPIGRFSLKELANVHPAGKNEFQSMTYTFHWTPNTLSVPTPLRCTGLNAVLPKY